jgi:hypothetical protein
MPVAGLGAIILAGAALGFALSRPPQRTPAPTPPPAPTAPRTAFGYSVADDPAHHEVVLFGGVDSYDHTWLWNGRRWTLAHPPASPTGRFDAPAAYDPDSRDVMLYGGRLADGELIGDTWAWDGVTWRDLDSGANGPPAGEGGAMAWDPVLHTMVLVVPIATPSGPSGETWLWRGDAWSRLTGSNFPADIAPIAAVFDVHALSHRWGRVEPDLPGRAVDLRAPSMGRGRVAAAAGTSTGVIRRARPRPGERTAARGRGERVSAEPLDQSGVVLDRRSVAPRERHVRTAVAAGRGDRLLRRPRAPLWRAHAADAGGAATDPRLGMGRRALAPPRPQQLTRWATRGGWRSDGVYRQIGVTGHQRHGRVRDAAIQSDPLPAAPSGEQRRKQ